MRSAVRLRNSKELRAEFERRVSAERYKTTDIYRELGDLTHQDMR